MPANTCSIKATARSSIHLTIEQDLVEHQQELEVQKGRLAEAEGAIEAHKQQRRQAEDEYKHTTLKDLAEAEQKATSLHEQLLQAAQKYRLQTLDRARWTARCSNLPCIPKAAW